LIKPDIFIFKILFRETVCKNIAKGIM